MLSTAAFHGSTVVSLPCTADFLWQQLNHHQNISAMLKQGMKKAGHLIS
jgi:hypothetical protein